MPKNQLIKSQNFHFKQPSFYCSMHFIFQNASKFHFETILSYLFSAELKNAEKLFGQEFQFQS